MRRREFITATAGAAIGLMLGRPRSATSSARPQRKPNVLFIMTDQQHAGMMSCTGNKWLNTPAMDRLAASGVRFERAYVCNPAWWHGHPGREPRAASPCHRFSLQTGLMPSAIGMAENSDSGRATVTDAMLQQSLGRLFQKAGYETVYGGKVHLPRNINDVQEIGYRKLTADARQGLADACATFIKGQHTRPFLLFASFINPHDICYMAINDFRRASGEVPVDNIDSRTCEAVLARAREAGDISAFVEKNCPPLPANVARPSWPCFHGLEAHATVPDAEPECITQKYITAAPFLLCEAALPTPPKQPLRLRRPDRCEERVRAHVRQNWTQDQWRLHRWAYCRLTEVVDREIGTVLDALREAGLEDNTLIVLTSDHGDMDSAHRMEHKSVLYEESVRVPFIMSYRGMIPTGIVDDTHLVSNGLDLLPTLCDYAGIEIPEGLPGRSLRPLAAAKDGTAWRDFVVCESQNGRMLRTDRFKYCIYDSGRGREQLTDLEHDAGEMRNLAEVRDYKDVLDTHRELLRGWVGKTVDRIAAEYLDPPDVRRIDVKWIRQAHHKP